MSCAVCLAAGCWVPVLKQTLCNNSLASSANPARFGNKKGILFLSCYYGFAYVYQPNTILAVLELYYSV